MRARTAVLDVGSKQAARQESPFDFARLGACDPLAVSEVIMFWSQNWLIEWFDPTSSKNQVAVIKAWTPELAIDRFRLLVSEAKAYPRVVPIVGIRSDGSIGGG